ncbi:aminomethyltransferase beta-barrel domain-containing protein, partial [Verrucomicrobiota bacterium]
PLYVTRLDAQHNVVEVGTHEQAMSQTCRLKDVHWIAGHPPANDRPYDLRIRYRHDGAPAQIRNDGDRLRVDFLSPQFAVTPGQAAVVYNEDEVLGGGWIASP